MNREGGVKYEQGGGEYEQGGGGKYERWRGDVRTMEGGSTNEGGGKYAQKYFSYFEKRTPDTL